MSASDMALRLVSAAVIASLKSGMSPETPVVSISIICSNFFLLSSETSAVRSVYDTREYGAEWDLIRIVVAAESNAKRAEKFDVRRPSLD